MYRQGQGVAQDHAQAAVWYRKAAEQGNADAQCVLGAYYDQGQSVPQDYGQAAQWFRKAAEQGDADAQSNLDALYDNGQGVPQDYVAAYALINLAAARESQDGDHWAFQARAKLADSMTQQKIEAAQALSRAMNRPGNLLKALDQYLATGQGR
jgi:TPR repeat protein